MSLLLVGRRSRRSPIRILASFIVKGARCVVVSMLWVVILRRRRGIWSQLTAVIIVACNTIISPWRSVVVTGSSEETHSATARADLITG